MDFQKLVPLIDFEEKATFQNCQSLGEFLDIATDLAVNSSELRTRQACLSIYMAIRDHYPSYLANWSAARKQHLDNLVEASDSKIIKLRRIVISAIAKAA